MCVSVSLRFLPPLRKKSVSDDILCVQEMLALCSDLKAFYAKVGQLVAMQAFVPEVIRAKLATLQSEMPLLPEAELHAALAASLPAGASLASTFARIDLGSALGSASIASVHYGELADARRTKVAVKIQLPAAEALMAGDLRNLRLLAAVLQKTDLKFDLVRPVDELRAQIASEFDFEAEAAAMRRVHSVLKARRVRGVRVPLPIPGLVSRTLLVMEYMDGLPLSRVERKAGKRAVRRLGRVVMRRLGEAYGAMILEGPSFFQADPHPGNLLVLNRKMDIALIDYGQTKSLSEAKRLAFAGLVDAMARRSPVDVAKGMKALGIVVEDVPERNGMAKRKIRLKRARGRSIKALSTGLGPAEGEGGNVSGGERGSSSDGLPPEQSVHVAVAARRSGPHLTSAEKLAYTMFDTAEYEGVSSNPFADESALRTATVSDLPKDLFFLLRYVQLSNSLSAIVNMYLLSSVSRFCSCTVFCIYSLDYLLPAATVFMLQNYSNHERHMCGDW